MNTKAKGRIWAILLSLAMIITMMPMMVFADVNPYTVNVTASPANGGTAIVEYTDDGFVAIDAVANGGYKFVRWTYENGVEAFDTPSHVFKPNGDRTLTAVFEEDPTNVSSYNLEMPNSITVNPYAQTTAFPIKVSALDLRRDANGNLPNSLNIKIQIQQDKLVNQSDPFAQKNITFRLSPQNSTNYALTEIEPFFQSVQTKQAYIVIKNDEWNSAVPGVYKGAITYKVGYHYPDESVNWVETDKSIPVNLTIPKYTTTVNNGTGSGEYAKGESVTVTANDPPAGQRFKEWTGADGLTFTSGGATTATATFTMPSEAVTLKATYEDMISIQDADIVLSNTAFTYNGEVQKPEIEMIGGKTLTEGTDYEASWSNDSSKNAGTYSVTITGKGNYTGTTSKTFTINPASIAEATVTGIENKVYTGEALEQTPEVKLGEVMLESGRDYIVSYNDNINVGTATMTITGKGNYTGSISKTFTIDKAVVKVTAPVGKTFTYNGSARTGVAAGSNYALSGTTKATNAGSYTATATLKTGDANSTYKWADGTTEAKSIKWTINRANNPLAMKPKTATVKYKSLKKKAQTLAVTKVITFTKNAKDKKNYTLSYAKKGKKSFKKYFAVNKTTGKVMVKKGLKKGTYKVQVKVKAIGNANYKASALKTVTFTVVVK